MTQIRTRIHEYLLRKNLPSKPAQRKSVALKEARSIGILFDGTQPEEREQVVKFAKKLKAEGKQVKLLAYFNNNLKSENFTYDYFNKKQLDWALRPNTHAAKEFMQKPFDLLLNLSKNPVAPLDYIAAYSKAGFRVGPVTENTICYDLMIEHQDKQSLSDFIKQVLHYLQLLQPKTATA